MIRFILLVCAASLAMSPVRADDTVRTCATFKAYQEFAFHRFEKGYVESLNFPIPAVVECTLREIAAIKLAQPGLTSDRVYAKICELANEGATPAVRYKAALVRLVFDFPQMFAEERGREFTNEQDLFTALGKRLYYATILMTR